MRPTLSFLPGETALPLPHCPLKASPFSLSHPQHDLSSLCSPHTSSTAPSERHCTFCHIVLTSPCVLPGLSVAAHLTTLCLSSTRSLFQVAFFTNTHRPSESYAILSMLVSLSEMKPTASPLSFAPPTFQSRQKRLAGYTRRTSLTASCLRSHSRSYIPADNCNH